jgi:hypothetical protein
LDFNDDFDVEDVDFDVDFDFDFDFEAILNVNAVFVAGFLEDEFLDAEDDFKL